MRGSSAPMTTNLYTQDAKYSAFSIFFERKSYFIFAGY